MYNSGLSPATPTPAAPTSPLTPTTPPTATPTAQTPPVAMVAPQTQAPAPVQQQPKKNLSLTVGTLSGFIAIRWMAYLCLFAAGGGSCCYGMSLAPTSSLYRENRCLLLRRCSRQQTRSLGQRRPSSWASWLALEVRLCY